MRNVALILGRGSRYSRELAFRLLAEGAIRGWPVQELAPGEDAALNAGRPDGLLVLPLEPEELASVRASGVPFVALGNLVAGLEHRVDVDDRLVAREASRALGGYSRYAYIGDLSRPLGIARRDAFLAVAPGPVEVLDRTPEVCPARPSYGFDPALLDFLTRLPEGTGIFASNDFFATLVHQALRVVERRCPDDLGLVGVDDDNGDGISSVRIPLDAIAAAAMTELGRRMDGKPPRSRLVPPAGVAERRTTRAADDFLLAVTDAIRLRAGDARFGVDELARDLGFSRRTLEWRLNRRSVTPLDLLRRHRAERAASLIEGGLSPLRRIVEEAGFGSENALRSAFKERFGTSPTEWSRRCVGAARRAR